MSIAWAIMEHLHEQADIRPRTLFATHYHELTALAASLERVVTTMPPCESGDKIVFYAKFFQEVPIVVTASRSPASQASARCARAGAAVTHQL